jgi:hypothetical protein
MIAAKISIGFFLLRITISKLHRWIIYGNVIISVLAGSVFLFVTIFQCSPVNYFWDRSSPSGNCINVEVIIGLTYFYSVVSAINDFTFGILPMFLVWGLQMDKRTKLALVPILSMACIASSAVLVRMAYVQDFKTQDFLCKITQENFLHD